MTSNKSRSKNNRNDERAVREQHHRQARTAESPWHLVESVSRYVRM